MLTEPDERNNIIDKLYSSDFLKWTHMLLSYFECDSNLFTKNVQNAKTNQW